MSALSRVALSVGAVLFCGNMIVLFCPGRMQDWVRKFPRSVWAAHVLVVIDVLWLAAILLNAQVNWIETHSFLFFCLAPVSYLLIIFFMDELLAARALGGLCLLAPVMILDAAFIHSGNSKLVMTLFAYLLVTTGIVLVWSPHVFRKATLSLAGSSQTCRVFGLAGGLIGLLMVLMGWFVY